MATIPTEVPAELHAGDDWQWNTTLADYTPDDGWALKYYLSGPSNPGALTADANAAGTGWEIRILAEATRGVVAGEYDVHGVVSKAAERFTISVDQVKVLPDPTDATVDRRSTNVRTLAVIDAALENRLTVDMAQFSINGRAVEHIPVTELRNLRTYYTSLVYQERNPGKLGPTVKAVFYG